MYEVGIRNKILSDVVEKVVHMESLYTYMYNAMLNFLQGFREGRFQVLVVTDVAATCKRLDLPEVDLIVQCKPPKVHVCKKEAVCVYISYECVVRERVCIMYVYARKERETDSMVHLLLLASYTCVLVIYACIQ